MLFEPINKNNKIRRTFNTNQLSIGDYIDEYFYYYIDKNMDLGNDIPISPINYVWNSQNLAYCDEEKVCMWMMELIENIAIITKNRKANGETNKALLEYTDAQAETFEDNDKSNNPQVLARALYDSVAGFTRKGFEASGLVSNFILECFNEE